MDVKRWILGLSLVFATGVWVLDAVVDFLFFFDASFLSLVLTDVPTHELFVRTLLSGSFLLFGVVSLWLVRRLESQQRQYETLVTNLPGIVYRCRNEPGWPMDVVRGRSEDLVGYSPADLESGAVSWGEDVIHPEDREMVWESVQAGIEADDSFAVTYRVRTAGGAERWIRERGRAVAGEESGPAVIEGVIVDVTKRKALEEHLRGTKDRYQALFESIQDAIVVADTDRRIVNCNPAFTDLFGYDLSDIEGEETAVLYEDEREFAAMETALEEHIDDPQFTFTVHYEKQSGRVFPGETSVFYLRDADDVVGYIGVIRDVSEREDHVHQLQVLDRVLRHNLHNAVNVVLGHAELIRASDPDRETLASVEKIIETSEGLVEMVGEEREITQVLSDRPPLETVDLCRVVERTVARVREDHPDADVSTDVPERCRALATETIGRAIEELIRNAVVHSDRGRPSVVVRVDPGEEVVRVRVADEGPGIPEMERTVLTGEAEVEPLYHGSGLGLWFVNIVVRQSDGTLTFDENERRGSVVTVSLQRP